MGKRSGKQFYWPSAVIAAGLLLVIIYHVLRLLRVSKIGAPTDIGGGLILLLGYILTGIGVAALAVVLRQRRSNGGPTDNP